MVLNEIIRFLSFFEILSFIVALIIVRIIWWYATIPSNIPPGPWTFPLIGNMHLLMKTNSEKTMVKLTEKYGNVFSLYFGSQITIVLGNYEAVKEAFIKQGDIFSGRIQDSQLSDDKGIILSDGEVWKEHRRFLITTLRDYGIGKLSLEPSIKEEITCLTNEIAKAKGEALDLKSLISVSVCNVIMALGFGHRFEYDDKQFKKFMKDFYDTERLTGKAFLITLFPWLKYIPKIDWLLGVKEFRDNKEKIDKFMIDEIEAHKRDYVDGSRKDYIDAFLTERKNIIEKTGNEGTFDMKELQDNVKGLFSAGTTTTCTTLLWALKFLTINPEIQKKIQKEIEDVVGYERMPSLSDKARMVYTEAVLSEVHRCASIVPLNIPRSNIEATTLFGYHIPKRSFIVSNLWFCMNDPKFWEDPDLFRPKRFLNDKRELIKPEGFIPFSAGKRVCLGESLARMELFLYLTCLLQRFTFKAPEGVTLNTECYETPFVREPKPFKLCAIERDTENKIP